MDEPIKVLLVDDDDVDRMAVRRALHQAAQDGVLVEDVATASAALSALRERPFDCLLLDHLLPDADAMTALGRLRAAGHLLPVIVLTGQGDEQLAVELMKAGVSDYLVKGIVSPDHLAQSVRTAVRVARAESMARDAQRRLAVLAEVSGILSSSLDYQKTLDNLADFAIRHFADLCVIDMLEESEQPVRRCVRHRDPSRQELATELMKRPLLLSSDHPSLKVLKTGVGEVRSTLDPAEMRAAVRDEQHLELVGRLEFHSTMNVPLLSHDKVLGVMGLVSTHPSRSFNEDDLALAQEIGRRAASAVEKARLYAQAQAANRAKDQFLAVLSHELRTPLTPVLMAVQALAESGLPPELADTFAMIRRNVELEARLIDDLLDLTRIARGKLQLNLELVDAHELLKNALDICRGDIRAKGIKLVTQLESARHWVYADPSRLQQIFWNLINNAAKFTPEDGALTLATFDEDERFVLSVTDTGVGIEPDVLPRIFDAFEQGEATVTRKFGGLGLGLAICRALVRMHWGTIHAHSDGKGKGATFTVKLSGHMPASRTLPADHQPLVETKDAPVCNCPERRRVLMVDDHDDTRLAMKRLLEKSGYSVTVADSVRGALDTVCAPEMPFDILISDIGLPDGSGLEIMRHLRERGKTVRGIALSGFGMEEDIKKSREAGFDHHLTKPVSFDRLKAVLEELAAQPM